MVRTRKAQLLALPALCTLGLAALAPTTAAAQPAAQTYSITLDPLNDSGAEGMAMLSMNDNGDLVVKVETVGMVPNQPHAQHVHGSADRTTDFMCPGADADKNGDGILTTSEGLPTYGDIFISLTTTGDTTKASALAVDRFPTADADGNLNYERTIPAAELPDGTAESIKNLHVVQHGIDVNGNGTYDADGAGPSDLDPALPGEATHPADCGMITGASVGEVPHGGVDTGAGGTGGVEALPMVAFGAVALAGAGGLMLARRRGDAGV